MDGSAARTGRPVRRADLSCAGRNDLAYRNQDPARRAAACCGEKEPVGAGARVGAFSSGDGFPGEQRLYERAYGAGGGFLSAW